MVAYIGVFGSLTRIVRIQAVTQKGCFAVRGKASRHLEAPVIGRPNLWNAPGGLEVLLHCAPRPEVLRVVLDGPLQGSPDEYLYRTVERR